MNEIQQDAYQMTIQASKQPDPSSEETIEYVLKSRPGYRTTPLKIGIFAASPHATKYTVRMKKASVSAAQSSGAEQATTKNTKPLSIADTLALNRAKMSVFAQRDYSSIDSLEAPLRSDARKTFLPPSQVSPRFSNKLSSLLQHKQTEMNSSNLMSVIRQMKDALMHNKQVLNSFKKAGQDTINSIKTSADEKKFFLKCLQAAIIFLYTEKDDNYKIKASRLIKSIAGSIDNRKPKNNPADVIHSKDNPLETLADILPSFYDTAFSSLTDLDLSRLRLVIAERNLVVDTREYADRVTEGNREYADHVTEGNREYADRVREENRERKKKWREENAERNKDNDLRCRVLKRATAQFGEAPSDEKSNWFEKEFLKRKNRRLSRQQKQQANLETPNSSDENTAQDPLFVKRITDIFNLVFESGFDEDPRAALFAIVSTCFTQSTKRQRPSFVKRHQLKQLPLTS